MKPAGKLSVATMLLDIRSAQKSATVKSIVNWVRAMDLITPGSQMRISTTGSTN